MRPGQPPHVVLETVADTLLYSDDQGQQQRRATAFLSLALLLSDEQQYGLQTCWRVFGPLGSVAQLIAEFYANNPGMREAVEGQYVLTQMIKQRRQT